MKTANCKNGKITVEADRFSSGRQYYPEGYVSGGRDDGHSFEYLDHYLIYDESETEGTICNGKPNGDYWFHNGREIPNSEAESVTIRYRFGLCHMRCTAEGQCRY